MEQKELTIPEAWDDFMKEVYPVLLPNISRKEMEAIWQANRARNGKTKYPLGSARVKKILSGYAPDRYEFVETVVVIIKTSDT